MAIEKIIEDFKKHNLKLTPQRLRVIQYLTKKGAMHFFVEDIYTDIRKIMPTISLATLYNVIQTLVTIGYLNAVPIDKEKRMYDTNLVPHNHFYCEECGNIYDVDVNYAKLDVESIIEKEKHYVKYFTTIFTGICKNCLSKKKQL